MSHFTGLDNKKVLVVGASSKIGMDIVSALDRMGCHLILWDRDRNDPESLQRNSTHEWVSDIDYFDLEIIEQGFKRQQTLFENLNGIVFCSSEGDLRPLSLTKPVHMLDLMSKNCFSFVEIVRLLSKRKFLLDGGSIVAISSVSGLVGLKSKLAYSASKAALNSVIRSLAVELGDRKIRANTIVKGGLTIDYELEHIRNAATISGDTILQSQFLGLTSLEELTGLTLFLLSDLSKTMTGQNLVLDGGYLA